MAGTLLHVTIANKALAGLEGRKPEKIVDSYFRLGAVLVDLPYYDRLWLTAVRTFLGRPLVFNDFGTLLHTVSPASLLLALLDGANDPKGKSLALGALTHHGVDLVFHPFIDKEVRATCDDPAGLDSAHKKLEDQIDLHCHYHLVGHSGMGRLYCTRALSFVMDPHWYKLPSQAFRSVHGKSPSPLELTRWMTNLNLFAAASSFSGAPWLETLPKDAPKLLAKSVELADSAITRCREYMEVGVDYMNGHLSPTEFLERIPDLSLADGGPAGSPLDQ